MNAVLLAAALMGNTIEMDVQVDFRTLGAATPYDGEIYPTNLSMYFDWDFTDAQVMSLEELPTPQLPAYVFTRDLMQPTVGPTTFTTANGEYVVSLFLPNGEDINMLDEERFRGLVDSGEAAINFKFYDPAIGFNFTSWWEATATGSDISVRAANTPEPSTGVLGLLGGLMCLAARRRRS